MAGKRFTDEQIVRILEEGDQGKLTIAELCRKHQISEATYYAWRKKFKGLQVKEVQRLKGLEQENVRLKKILAESILEKEALREILKKH